VNNTTTTTTTTTTTKGIPSNTYNRKVFKLSTHGEQN
jgi:hypothetical protein